MPRKPLLGTYAGSTREAGGHVDAAERWLGTSFDVQHVFTPWDERGDAGPYLFDEVLPPILAAGRVPLVTWEPYTPSPERTPRDVTRLVATGAYDEYVRDWIRGLEAALDGADPAGDGACDLYLRVAHEANGDWYPWRPRDDGASYVRMWRRLHDLFEDGSLDGRIGWIWAVNHVDVGPVGIEALYPGDRYVDRVGIDGFNWGATRPWSTWRSPEALFGDAIDRVRALSAAPIDVTEVGCTTLTESGHDPARKDGWIAEAFDYFGDRGIDTVCWFDVDKETDWAVFGGERGAETWRDRFDGSTYAVYPSLERSVGVRRDDPSGA